MSELMKESVNRRRQVENEVVFKHANEKVNKQVDAIQKSAKSEGYPELAYDNDLPLHFYCECADEECQDRISMKQTLYKKMHKNSNQFIVLPGHNVPEIEKIIKTTKQYTLVEKYLPVPKQVTGLKHTIK